MSFRFLPLTSTVSPRKSWSFSIVLVCMEITELSSLGESSTMSRFGACLRRRIAVASSLCVRTCAPPTRTHKRKRLSSFARGSLSAVPAALSALTLSPPRLVVPPSLLLLSARPVRAFHRRAPHWSVQPRFPFALPSAVADCWNPQFVAMQLSLLFRPKPTSNAPTRMCARPLSQPKKLDDRTRSPPPQRSMAHGARARAKNAGAAQRRTKRANVARFRC